MSFLENCFTNTQQEVNHRFIDGLHLGKFYEKLQADIDAL